MATKLTTEYLSLTNAFKTGQRYVWLRGRSFGAEDHLGTPVGCLLSHTQTPLLVLLRSVTISGGMLSQLSSLRMMPC